MHVETFKKKDRMTNSQKKIFFNLEIRVANDSHKKIECHETVTHADLPHSRTPV